MTTSRGPGRIGGALRALNETAHYLIGSGLYRGLIVFATPLLTRAMSADDYGRYSLGLAIASLVAALAGIGAPQYLTAHHDRLSRANKLQAGLVACAAAIACGAVVAGVAIGLVVMFVASETWAQLLAAAYVLGLGRAAMALASTLYQMESKSRQFLALMSVPAITVLAGAVFLLLSGRGGSSTLLLIEAGAIVLGLAIGRSHSARFVGPPQQGEIRAVVRFGLPLMPHLVALWGLNLSDRIIVEYYAGSTELGIYTAAYSVALGLSLVFESAQRVWQPASYRAWGSGEAHRMRRIRPAYLLGGAATVVAALSYWALVVMLYRFLVPASYWSGQQLLLPLCLGYGLHGIYRILGNRPFYDGMTGFLGGVSMSAFILNVVLNLLWVPRYGLMGAAWATAAAFGLQVVGSGVLAATLPPFRSGRRVD